MQKLFFLFYLVPLAAPGHFKDSTSGASIQARSPRLHLPQAPLWLRFLLACVLEAPLKWVAAVLPEKVSKSSGGEEEIGFLRHTEIKCLSWSKAWRRNQNREGWNWRQLTQEGLALPVVVLRNGGFVEVRFPKALFSFLCLGLSAFSINRCCCGICANDGQSPRNNPAQCRPQRWLT